MFLSISVQAVYRNPRIPYYCDMELKDIVSVSGKPGLFRILKPTRNGMILESLDEKKKKLVATANYRVSALNEISIYTLDDAGSKPLEEILKKIHDEFGDDPGLDSSSSPGEFSSFLQHILPEYDTERVYPSDIKRLVSWYRVLLKMAPDLLKGNSDGGGEEE